MFGETVPDDRSRDVWKIRLRSSVVVLSTATSRPRHAERRPVAGNIRGGSDGNCQTGRCECFIPVVYRPPHKFIVQTSPDSHELADRRRHKLSSYRPTRRNSTVLLRPVGQCELGMTARTQPM